MARRPRSPTANILYRYKEPTHRTSACEEGLLWLVESAINERSGVMSLLQDLHASIAPKTASLASFLLEGKCRNG